MSPNDGINKLMKGGFRANWDFKWSNLNITTMVMTGHHDKVFRVPNDIDNLINSMKKVIRIEIPECGHLIPLGATCFIFLSFKRFLNNLS